ncbi:MAG TPA: [protein-PII] uridylyltransferase [Candidatus Aquicultor sp.]
MATASGIAKRYTDGLATLEKAYAARPSGRENAQHHADLVDEVIIALYNEVIAEPGLGYDPGSNDIAIIALGGYGRRELCPYSDIDLMILHRIKDKALIAGITEKLFYPLWDLGLQVGYGTRTVKESLVMASANFELQTSFLEARLIIGNGELLTQLETGLTKELRARGGRRFIELILKENETRHTQAGQAAYLLEPDLKEGEGGLRDIHAMLWAAKGLLGYSTIRQLTQSDYLSEFDADKLEEGFEFLLTIRSLLHYLTGRKNDRLFFEHQLEISKRLGFKDANGISGIEKFMRAFYMHASAIELTQRSFWEQIKTDYLGAVPVNQAKGAHETTPGIIMTGGGLSLESTTVVGMHPGSEIKLFTKAVTEHVPIAYGNLGFIREGIDAIDLQPAWTHATREDFIALLKAGRAAIPALEVMDYLGVVARYIPEWSAVRCLPQYDSYHLYTVDMHLYLTVAELEKFGSGFYDATNPLFEQIYNEIEQKDLLFVAGLLHDIGKGRGKNHSENGARIATAICKRMGFSESDVETIVFLVANHLLLSDAALRRDLDDENVIVETAETIVNEERLKMLYLISIADSLATGPKAWDMWKDNLLRELFIKTLHIIKSGEYTGEQTIERLRVTEAGVKSALVARYYDADIDRFLKQMPHSYLLTQDIADIIDHFKQAFETQHTGTPVSVKVKRINGIHELVLIAKDQPGLFSKVSGVLAIHGINILGAQVYTRSDGGALDIFKIAGYFDQGLHAADQDVLAKDIARALEGKIALEYRIAEKAKRYQNQKKHTLKKPARVEVDNESSDFYTIIEVHAEDRIGLLYTITRVMFELNLDIHLAKVSTNVDKVIDVFYVWDMYGQKLSDAEQILDVKRAILMALE